MHREEWGHRAATTFAGFAGSAAVARRCTTAEQQLWFIRGGGACSRRPMATRIGAAR